MRELNFEKEDFLGGDFRYNGRQSLIGKRRVTTNSRVRCTQITDHPLPGKVFTWEESFLLDVGWIIEKRMSTKIWSTISIFVHCTYTWIALKQNHSDQKEVRNAKFIIVTNAIASVSIHCYKCYILLFLPWTQFSSSLRLQQHQQQCHKGGFGLTTLFV